MRNARNRILPAFGLPRLRSGLLVLGIALGGLSVAQPVAAAPPTPSLHNASAPAGLIEAGFKSKYYGRRFGHGRKVIVKKGFGHSGFAKKGVVTKGFGHPSFFVKKFGHGKFVKKRYY